MNNRNNTLLVQRIDSLGLTLIGLISLGYCCFLARFAELNIQLPFLNFPIFIGEICLFVCLLLLFFKLKIKGQQRTIWGALVLVYVAFVLGKAFVGYLNWGPLALRHAALFYYPLFAVLGYSFFRNEYFTGKKALFLIVLFVFILAADTKFLHIIQWDRIVCFILAFILIKQQPAKKIRYSLLTVLFICAPYRLFFLGQRTLLVSSAATIVFLFIAITLAARKRKNAGIVFTVILSLVLYLGVMNKIYDKNALRSILNTQENIKEYKKLKAEIAAKESTFKMHPIERVYIYNNDIAAIKKPENEKLAELIKLSSQFHISTALNQEVKVKQKTNHLEEKKLKDQSQKETNQTQEHLSAGRVLLPTNSILDLALKGANVTLDNVEFEKSILSQSERNPEELYGNTCFRVLIWEDMIADLVTRKPIFGFDFGKPFRSRQIEILNIGWGDWSRDGWIAAHNSYLEIIYRSGIIGIILILLIFIVFLKLVLLSIISKSLLGILLCGILVNWLTAANFMLIFELPYYAVPLWSIMGMTIAYLMKSNKKPKVI